MRSFLILLTLLSFLSCMVFTSASAEFHTGDSLNVSVNAHGNTDYQTGTLTATYPLEFIDGYIGWEWARFQATEDEFESHDNIRARIDGGYHFEKIGIRGYGRYESETSSEQESLLHGGIYLHADILQKDNFEFNMGLGSWLSQEEINPIYEIDTTVEYGPQLHAELKISKFSILAEFLPKHSFDNYSIRIVPILIIPIFKISAIDSISIQISGKAEYSSNPFGDTDSWQWYWKKGLHFSF